MITDALALERTAGERLHSYLSDDSLFYDRFLTSKISQSDDGWLDLNLFTAFNGRLYCLTNDEAVIAMAVKQFHPDLEISDDGKKVRRRKPLPDFSDIDCRTIYVEHLPRTMTAEYLKSTMEGIGSVERIIFYPFARSTPAHGFVIFVNPTSVDLALQRSCWRSIYPNMDVKSFLDEDDTIQVEGGIPFHMMAKPDWTKRMDEYAGILEEKRRILEKAVSSTSGTHERQFESGVVARFEGVHPATGGKVLKKLFELIAPVAYVDYKVKSTSGHVRFKSAKGASLACTYFSRECVTQKHKDDTGTLLIEETKKRTKQRMEEAAVESWGWEEPNNVDESYRDSKNAYIILRRISGHEERNYWDMIGHQRADKHHNQPPVISHRPRLPAPPVAQSTAAKPSGTHVTFAEYDEEAAGGEGSSIPQAKSIHVTFADSEDEEATAAVEKESGTKGSRKRPLEHETEGTDAAADGSSKKPRKRQKSKGKLQGKDASVPSGTG